MKSFFQNQDYPFIFFVLYILKSVALPGGFVDAAILLILASYILVKYIFDKLQGTKKVIIEKIIENENEFRAKLNVDIGLIADRLNTIEIKSAANFTGFGKKK